MSRNDNAQTPDERTGDTTYAFPAHLLGELDAPAAEGVEPRVSAAEGSPSRSARLLVMRGPNAGSQFLLDQPVTSAGRHPDSDIFLDDATVSRSAESVIFHNELRELEATQPGYRLHLQLTHEDGKVDFENLDHLVSDWTFAHCVSPNAYGGTDRLRVEGRERKQCPAFPD